MGAFTPTKLHLDGEAVAQVSEAAQDAMVVIGPDGGIAHVNTRAEELFGYPQEELLGQRQARRHDPTGRRSARRYPKHPPG